MQGASAEHMVKCEVIEGTWEDTQHRVWLRQQIIKWFNINYLVQNVLQSELRHHLINVK